MSFKQKVVIGITDVLIIVELCVAVIMANRNPDEFTPVFFKVFLSMAVPTILIAIFIVRRYKTVVQDPE